MSEAFVAVLLFAVATPAISVGFLVHHLGRMQALLNETERRWRDAEDRAAATFDDLGRVSQALERCVDHQPAEQKNALKELLTDVRGER